MNLPGRFIVNFVTIFRLGFTSFAPGTFGSIAAYPFMTIIGLIIIFLARHISFLHNPFIIISLLLLILLILFIMGCKYSQTYVDHTGREDPKEVIIDEIVGQALVLVAIIPLYPELTHKKSSFFIIMALIIVPFILFRIFDILKPWPINWIDKNVKGGFGIMLDDVIAALMAIVIYYNLYYIFI